MNGVSVAQIVIVSEHRYAALPAELAGSLVLSAADALAALSLRVGPQDLVLMEDGTIRVCGGVPTDEESVEMALRTLLDRILLSSCSVTPSLLRAARRNCQGSVSVLVRELEVALIPTNRSAARRALARLCREVSNSIRHYPGLQQAADVLLFADSVSVDLSVVSAAAAAQPIIAASKIQESRIDICPVFSEAADMTAECEIADWVANSSIPMNIPDLEIPNLAKRHGHQESNGWQPVKHTQRLRPATSGPATASAPDIIELSDDDLLEVTSELPLPTRVATHAMSPQPPIPTSTPPIVPLEYQTAEPFLLVLPPLAQEPRNKEGLTVPPCVEWKGPVDAATSEPCASEADDTVLDAVTSVRDASLESCPVHEDNLGRHTYAAPARFSRARSNIGDCVAQFAVPRTPGPDELVRDLRSLAGIENEPSLVQTTTSPAPVHTSEKVVLGPA